MLASGANPLRGVAGDWSASTKLLSGMLGEACYRCRIRVSQIAMRAQRVVGKGRGVRLENFDEYLFICDGAKAHDKPEMTV